MSAGHRRYRWIRALPYVVFGYLLRVAVAVVLTHPFVSVVKRTLGGWPDGDRMLYEPGALMLSEVLRLHGTALTGLLEQSALASLLMVPVGAMVASIVLSALASERPRDALHVVTSALRHFAPVAWLTLLQLVGVGGTLLLALVTREGFASAMRGTFSPRTADIASASTLVVGLAAVCAIVIVTDTARAAAVREKLDTASAVVHALRVGARRPGALGAAFAARASAALLVLTSTLATALHLGLEAPLHAAAVLTMAHAGAFVTACLRASWLARAMDLATAVEVSGAGFDRSPRSDAPSDPTPSPDS